MQQIEGSIDGALIQLDEKTAGRRHTCLAQPMLVRIKLAASTFESVDRWKINTEATKTLDIRLEIITRKNAMDALIYTREDM